MPLDKFVLIVVLVIAAAGVTIWLAALLAAMLQVPLIGWAGALPALVIGYVLFRVIADRMRSRDDDHYDGIEK